MGNLLIPVVLDKIESSLNEPYRPVIISIKSDLDRIQFRLNFETLRRKIDLAQIFFTSPKAVESCSINLNHPIQIYKLVEGYICPLTNLGMSMRVEDIQNRLDIFDIVNASPVFTSLSKGHCSLNNKMSDPSSLSLSSGVAELCY